MAARLRPRRAPRLTMAAVTVALPSMVTDTSFMRNPHYHRAGDTHDTLDDRRMAQVVQGVYALAQGC